MALAIDAAEQVGAKLVLGDSGLAAYSAAAEDPRCRDKDSRVVYRWYATSDRHFVWLTDLFRLGGVEPNVGN